MLLCNTVMALSHPLSKHNAQKGCESREPAKPVDKNLATSETVPMQYSAPFDKVSLWHFPFCIKRPIKLALRTRLLAGHSGKLRDALGVQPVDFSHYAWCFGR